MDDTGWLFFRSKPHRHDFLRKKPLAGSGYTDIIEAHIFCIISNGPSICLVHDDGILNLIPGFILIQSYHHTWTGTVVKANANLNDLNSWFVLQSKSVVGNSNFPCFINLIEKERQQERNECLIFAANDCRSRQLEAENLYQTGQVGQQWQSSNLHRC